MSKTISRELKALLDKILKAVGDDIVSKLDELGKEIESCGGLKSACALAWNLEEKDVESYSFKECVSWIKAHINKENARGAFVHKKEGKSLFNKKYEINVFFFDDNKNPLKGDNNSWLIVHCNSIDNDFIQNFGDKDTLVLQ